MKRRYNYLSHMVDSSTDSVARVAKISAFWASMSQAVITINLVHMVFNGIVSPIALVLISFLLWSAVFGVMIVTQLGWISHLVFNGLDDYPPGVPEPPHPTPLDVTRHYKFDGKSYKIDKVVERVGGSEVELPKKDE